VVTLGLRRSCGMPNGSQGTNFLPRDAFLRNANDKRGTNFLPRDTFLRNVPYGMLNKLMTLFKKSAPEFYGEYRTARNIIFNRERKRKTVN
jgi:hypothetical protein